MPDRDQRLEQEQQNKLVRARGQRPGPTQQRQTMPLLSGQRNSRPRAVVRIARAIN